MRIDISGWWAVVAAFGALSSPAWASETADEAREWVRRAVQKEAARTGRYCFTWLKRDDRGRMERRRAVETDALTLFTATHLDGVPLSGAERRREQLRAWRMAHEPRARARAIRAEAEHEGRISRIMAALPDALRFTFRKRSGDRVELAFEPDPAAHGGGVEAAILRCARGTLWVDLRAERLVRMEGELVCHAPLWWAGAVDVERGGRFVIAQAPVPGGGWRRTILKLDLVGRAAFGALRFPMVLHEESSDFRTAGACAQDSSGTSVSARHSGQ